MAKWCKRILKNKTDWKHVIGVAKQRLVNRAKPFTPKNGELYRMGQDNRLQWCLITIEAHMAMKELH
jgi:hypothetical protein